MAGCDDSEPSRVNPHIAGFIVKIDINGRMRRLQTETNVAELIVKINAHVLNSVTYLGRPPVSKHVDRFSYNHVFHLSGWEDFATVSAGIVFPCRSSRTASAIIHFSGMAAKPVRVLVVRVVNARDRKSTRPSA